MFSLSRFPKIWLTAGVAVSIIGLLLIGFRSQYSRYSPTFYTPPPPISPDQKPGNVDGPVQTPPAGGAKSHPADIHSADTRPTQAATSAHPETIELQSLGDTQNATLGVRQPWLAPQVEC